MTQALPQLSNNEFLQALKGMVSDSNITNIAELAASLLSSHKELPLSSHITERNVPTVLDVEIINGNSNQLIFRVELINGQSFTGVASQQHDIYAPDSVIFTTLT